MEQSLTNKATLAERFQAKVGKSLPNGCMEWQAQLWPNGYGVAWNNKRRYLAHRIAYSLEHGDIPAGMVVMHTCDNRKCVNPAHLILGTQQDNIADAVAKKRTRRSKLLPHLKDILTKRAEGVTQQQIADEYQVSRPLVSMFLGGVLLTK